MESELADERQGPREPRPAWDALWPPRRDREPERHATPASGVAAATPVSMTGDASDVDGRFDVRLADLSKVMETRHAELVRRTASELDAIRESIEAALGATEKRLAEHLQRVEAGAAPAADLAALRSRVDDALQTVLSTPTDDDRLGALEERLFSSMRETLRGIEERSAQLVGQLEADVKALRTDLGAAVAEQVEARADALEREAAREGALETRLRAELQTVVGSEVATLRNLDETRHALTERVDRVETQVATVSGELAQLRSQLVETWAGEIREDVDRLSQAVAAHRAETATRADLVALEDRVTEELASAQSEMQSRLTMLDAVVHAVDAAAASLDTGLVERMTGMATVAASSALAPVRSDLRAVHDEVAATQKSIRELRRRIRTALPPSAPAGGPLPISNRAGPKRTATPRKGAGG